MQSAALSDFIVGLGVLFVIEGLLLLGVPGWIRGAMESVIKTPDNLLRITGLISAVGGLISDLADAPLAPCFAVLACDIGIVHKIAASWGETAEFAHVKLIPLAGKKR